MEISFRFKRTEKTIEIGFLIWQQGILVFFDVKDVEFRVDWVFVFVIFDDFYFIRYFT